MTQGLNNLSLLVIDLEFFMLNSIKKQLKSDCVSITFNDCWKIVVAGAYLMFSVAWIIGVISEKTAVHIICVQSRTRPSTVGSCMLQIVINLLSKTLAVVSKLAPLAEKAEDKALELLQVVLDKRLKKTGYGVADVQLSEVITNPALKHKEVICFETYYGDKREDYPISVEYKNRPDQDIIVMIESVGWFACEHSQTLERFFICRCANGYYWGVKSFNSDRPEKGMTVQFSKRYGRLMEAVNRLNCHDSYFSNDIL